ncbi:MAG TPA: GNAT family N-acetyltransferase [Chromatiaceae bacterium]|nr:GNAT family N-acetyltransferase [Chromatiaceae bacterium]
MTPLRLQAVPALAADEAQALAETLARMEPWLTLGYSAESLARGLATPDPGLTRHLILRGGETLGLVAVRCPWLRGAYIELFAVLPGSQGQGVGEEVLGRLEQEYRGRTGNLWLLVSGFNAGARRFYERQGFGAIGVIPDLVAQGQDEILMRKVLRASPSP